MSIKWEGLDELEKGLNSVANGFDKGIKQGLMEPAASIGEQMMKRHAPIDTGDLKASTSTTRITRSTIVWRSKVPYAGYQDFGTARQPGTPYFRSSIISLVRLMRRRSPARLRSSLGKTLRSGNPWDPKGLI